jgi:hypothetical protein
MGCSEKEELQRSCENAWTTFESAIESLGVKLDPNIGPIMARMIEGCRGQQALIDPQTGTLKAAYRDAFGLLREHQKASSQLSRHLHFHRC